MRALSLVLLLLALVVPAHAADPEGVWDRVAHHTVKNGDVSIHYVTLGDGDPVLFIHGFPDIWYSWRHQMDTLSGDFKTAAMDLRGYNRSDQPEGVEHYQMQHILGDVAAVVDDLGGRVNLVGHDWGGGIAWRFAMTHPDMVRNLIILNLTHPKGYAAVVANPTPEQKANTEYARNFAQSKPDGSPVPDRILAMGDRYGETVGKHYREALGRSSFDGMLNYYRANYGGATGGGEMPDLAMPVLQFHGLQDTAVDKDGLRNTWDWMEKDYTLVTVPSAGHFVQWEAPEIVSQTMLSWLKLRTRD